VGVCYFALCCGRGSYLLRKRFSEVRTRFHLRHPWWIPVKFIVKIRALCWTLRLWRRPHNCWTTFYVRLPQHIEGLILCGLPPIRGWITFDSSPMLLSCFLCLENEGF